MSARRSLSLGTKINIGLLLLLLLLGAAASLIVLYGFDRTKTNASSRSSDALQEQGKLTLLALVGGLSDMGGIEAARAGQIGQSAAVFLNDSNSQQGRRFVDVSGYARTDNGIWYDPSPGRLSDVVVPGVAEISAGAQDDIAYSAPLDALARALTESIQDEISRAFRPIAIVFVGANRIARYYPPIGIQDTTPPDADPARLLEEVGPDRNPQRSTIWTSPYEDVQGRGLVMTAHTPVYDGDSLRGAMEVDISIANLASLLDGMQPTPSGFAFYLARDGSILGTKAEALLGGESASNKDLAAILSAARGESADRPAVDSGAVTLGGREYLVAHAPVDGFGGSVAAAAPIDEVTAGAAPIASGISRDANRTLWAMLASIGALFLGALAAATYFNRRAIVRPLAALAGATARVSAGDLGVTVPVDRRDELGELATSFNMMVGQLRESERVLEQRVEDRTRELTTLLEVVRNVGSTLELQPLLELILEQLRAIIPYDRSLIMILEGEELRVLAMRAEPGFEMEPSQLHLRAPIAEGGIIWELIERGDAAIIEDTRGDTPLAVAWRRNNEQVLESALRRVGSWMAVSIRHGDRTIGMLAASKEQPGFFTQQHAELATALGTHAGVAINNAELYQKSQHAASLEERQRLARELHDSVSQALYGIALGTRTARLRLGDDPHNASEPIDYVASLAQAGLAEMRALIFELRPESLEQEGLVAAIEKQAASIAARYKLDVHLELGEEPDCTLDAKEALYRIAQEALHNVVKHAQAKRVEVGLHRSDGAIDLVVRDDGRGFDATKSFPGHVGLQSMPERANKLGGTVTVDSAAGRGTTVRASVPLRPTAAGASPATEDRAGA